MSEDQRIITARRVSLHEIASGRLIEQLEAEVERIAALVVESRRKGGVTLTIEITPALGSEIMAVFRGQVASKPPRGPVETGMAHAYEGALYREDPRQPALDLRVVNDDEEVRLDAGGELAI